MRWTPRRLLPASDDGLARMVTAGNEEAFAALYDRYHQRLYRYCRSMLGKDEDAQDALQSTFAGAYAALAQGRRDAPIRPWLYRIAHNESVSVMRRRRPEMEISADRVPPAASAAEVAAERGRLALLMADLAALTERQRAALVMRELGGLSHAEIAAALTIDESGAKQTIFEARCSLHEFAEGRAMICEEVCRAISIGGGRTLRSRKVRAHLRDCQGCQAFADAIPSRTKSLHALAPPLAGAAATSIMRRAIASGAGPGGGGGAGVAAGTAGKTASVMAVGKALAGAAPWPPHRRAIAGLRPGPWPPSRSVRERLLLGARARPRRPPRAGRAGGRREPWRQPGRPHVTDARRDPPHGVPRPNIRRPRRALAFGARGRMHGRR
jgi:RNA polymerase sigma factor (sigma-70 family)